MTPQPISADLTTLDAARANVLASSQNQIAHLNADLILRYHQAYQDYIANMQSGQNVPAARRVPPAPPMAWELAPADPWGFVYYQIGTTPVCPQLPAVPCAADNAIPASNPSGPFGGNAAPGTAPVFELGGTTGNPGWFSVGASDTEPNGFQTTIPGPDGKLITIRRGRTPWGGYYQQVG